MKGTKEFYDKTAEDWALRGYASDGELICLQSFLNMVPKHSRVLDICCGAGYGTMRISQYGYEALGIDFSQESLKIARERNPELTFYEQDILEDYSYVGPVDAAVVAAGLVHVEKEQLPIAFQRMKDIVKTDGLLLFSIREGEGRMDERSLTTIDGEDYDRNFIAHNKDELIQAAKEMMEFVCELETDMVVWKNYVFRMK